LSFKEMSRGLFHL